MNPAPDLRRLAELETGARSVTTVYLKSPRSLASFEGRMRQLRKALSAHPEELARFEDNAARIAKRFEDSPFQSGGLYLVCCQERDLLEVYRLDFLHERLPLSDGVWFDSSPYIRPLAELYDEYESYVLVVADQSSARVDVLTASGGRETEQALWGEIKNRVKKGGWSQQRYARRRVKQIVDYASEIAEAIERVERRQSFRRIVLLGSQEVTAALEAALPLRLRNKLIAREALSSSSRDADIEAIASELVQRAEREEELDLWEAIRAAYLQQGRAVVGAMDVHVALNQGRVHALLVQREARVAGTRCAFCSHLSLGSSELCTLCGEREPFPIDMINEFVELAAKTGSRVEFCDPHEELDAFEGVAALLRY